MTGETLRQTVAITNLQGFHISGLQDSKIGYFQDGTFAVANNNGTIYTTDPIQSTVEEVKILSTTLPAEYGHSAGGAMTSVLWATDFLNRSISPGI